MQLALAKLHSPIRLCRHSRHISTDSMGYLVEPLPVENFSMTRKLWNDSANALNLCLCKKKIRKYYVNRDVSQKVTYIIVVISRLCLQLFQVNTGNDGIVKFIALNSDPCPLGNKKQLCIDFCQVFASGSRNIHISKSYSKLDMLRRPDIS